VPRAARPLTAALALAGLALAALLAGCGNSRSAAPDLTTPHPPRGMVTRTLHGVRFRAPADWTLRPGVAPQLAQVASGRAVVALWRYPRKAPLPVGSAQLAQARTQLIKVVRRRQHSIHLRHTRIFRVHGMPAVELIADEHVAGQPRRVRSTHIYAQGIELVVDAYAPPKDFTRVDDAVFVPLTESVRIGRQPASKPATTTTPSTTTTPPTATTPPPTTTAPPPATTTPPTTTTPPPSTTAPGA
jgi:hypothetical protein